MLKLLILLPFYSVSVIYGQMLDNTEGKTFGDVPFFNENFIKKNKVKTIKGYYATKATLDYIRPSKDVYWYEFNNAGQLIQDYRTQYGDTLVSLYEYDEEGRLSILRKSDNNGFYSNHYSYDERGRLLSDEYRRDLNKTGDIASFSLNKSFFVSEEKYGYIELEGKNYKKIYYNTAGRIYKEEFYYFNADGYLLKQEGRLKMGSGITNILFKYDAKGRVIEKEVEKRIMSKSISKWKYEYDEQSNVMAQHYYKNGKYVTELQLVYQDATMLLDAIISQDEETSLVTILQFSDYTFFQ